MNRRADKRTDRKVTFERPQIMCKDTLYLQNYMIIGGPLTRNCTEILYCNSILHKESFDKMTNLGLKCLKLGTGKDMECELEALEINPHGCTSQL